MFCRNCGKDVAFDQKFCSNCGALSGNGTNFCHQCASPTMSGSTVCVNCGVKLNSQNFSATSANVNTQPKSKIAAGLLGILIGAFGVHNFYLGYTNRAVAQLLITVLSCGALSIVSGIWGLVEGIYYLTGHIGYTTDAQGVPLQD